MRQDSDTAFHYLDRGLIYDFPFGKGEKWFQSGVGLFILGGWTISGIQRYTSGRPLSITDGNFDANALFNPGLRADVVLPQDQWVNSSKPACRIQTGSEDQSERAIQVRQCSALPLLDSVRTCRSSHGRIWVFAKAPGGLLKLAPAQPKKRYIPGQYKLTMGRASFRGSSLVACLELKEIPFSAASMEAKDTVTKS